MWTQAACKAFTARPDPAPPRLPPGAPRPGRLPPWCAKHGFEESAPKPGGFEQIQSSFYGHILGENVLPGVKFHA